MIDLHDVLSRDEKDLSGPTLSIDANGCMWAVMVRHPTALKGRTKVSRITGSGFSPSDAADNLIASLDHWVAALT